jgi:nucleoside-diphosphate-sugar epimerase
VRLLEGDPAAIDFGLGRANYAELLESVKVIHNVYQVVDLGAPAAVAESVNIGGTREIIEFCRAARGLTRVVHHSSLFVSGDRSGVFLERDLHVYQSFRSPVAASLALAEAMLRRHPEVPLTVVRTGQVVSREPTALVDPMGGVYPLLVFLVNAPSDVPLPLPPKVEGPLYLVPADYVAGAALHLGGLAETLGETLHLVDPNPISARRFLELAAAFFGKRIEPGFNPSAISRSLFNGQGMGLLAQTLRAVADLVARDVTFDASVAAERLAGSGIECPPVESYLDSLLRQVAERVRDRRSSDLRGREPADVAS